MERKGGLEWRQEEPNTMIMRWPDRPAEIIRTSNGYIVDIAAHIIPVRRAGIRKAIEAFANLYRNFALALRSILAGEEPAPETLSFPLPKTVSVACGLSRRL